MGPFATLEPSAPVAPARPAPAPPAGQAVFEVLVCSGLVTQVGVAGVLALAGFWPEVSLAYITTLSLADTVLVAFLVVVLLQRTGDEPREVLFGGRPWLREAVAGVWQVPLVFLVTLSLGMAILTVAPSLHNVERNPLEALLASPVDTLVFAVVAVVAGGLREEMQRAFVLTRFRQSLGGATLGLAIFSVVFGVGHLLQGYDAAIITGALGLLWGISYLRRGSIVAPLVSHAVFNLIEVVRFGFF
jgi:membrane protease YdiL (CAAX protease family)